MPVETDVDGVEDLNPAWPTGADPKSEGDDHIRNTKAALAGSFPNMDGAWKTSDPIEAGPATTDEQLLRRGQLLLESCGSVAADGSVLGGDSANWGIIKLGSGLGRYRITFNDAAAGQYDQSVAATPLVDLAFSGDVTCHVDFDSATVCNVALFNAGVAQDLAFTFIRKAVRP